MKFKFITNSIITIFLIILFSGCDLLNKKEDNNKPVDKFLVSYEVVKSYLPQFIQTVFNQFSDDYPELATIKDKAQYGIFIHKLTYYTIFNGELTKASGLVCSPIGEGPFPILSYQNGTNTLHANAPSVNPDYELYLLLEFVASTGFVVVIPDYLGFGESDDMFHPYLHKESTVQTVLDMIRATKELANNYLNLELSDDLYIAGYSQGGWATMQIQKEIELKHAGEFNLVASACGAGPYDLNYINEYVTDLNTYPMPYFLGFMYNSYFNLGVTTSPADIFQEPYATKILSLYDGTKTGGEINEELTTSIPQLFTADYIQNYSTDSKYAPIISMLTQNSVTAWETNIPTMITHGMEDDFVPKEVSSKLYQGFLQNGVSIADVKWVPMPGLGHSSGIIPSGLASVNWFLELRDN